MKANLKFNLEDKDDSMSLRCCLKSTEMAIVLFEIVFNMSRSVEVSDEVMKFILDEMDRRGVNLNELVE